VARGPLTFKQTDLERALKAAQKAGAGEVWVAKDGSIHISVLAEQAEGLHAGKPCEPSNSGRDIVL